MGTSIEHRLSLSEFEFDTPELATIDNDMVIANSELLPWKTLFQTLSLEEVSILKDAPQRRYDAKDGLELVQACSACLRTCTEEDVVQFVLVVLEEFLQHNHDATSLFFTVRGTDCDIYSVLLRILARNNYHPFAIEKACNILALLISLSHHRDEDKTISMFGAWLNAKSGDVRDRCHNAAISSLKTFLKRPHAQELFAEEGGLSGLARTLRAESGRNTQIVYQAGFCLWLLSFNANILPMFARDNVVPVLIDTILTVSRVKVARVIVGCIRNLLGHLSFNEMLLNRNVPSVLDTLELRTTNMDPEMAADIALIRAELSKDAKLFSSFEVFQQELLLGELKWGPVHTEAFWKENATKCELDGFAPIKRMIALLESAHDPTVAICCFDLGEFARIYPSGKQIVRKLGGQARLMLKMSHEDQDVQQHALLCVQKIMVNNWAVLQHKSQK